MKLVKTTIALTLALLTLLVFALPATAANVDTYMYAKYATTIRSGPSSSSDQLGKLSEGGVGLYLGVSGSWTYIATKDTMGYVLSSKLGIYTGTPPAGTPSSITITGGADVMEATGSVNVRKGPGTGYAKLGQLTIGQRVTRVGTSGSWTEITWNDSTAYVSTQFLKLVQGAQSLEGVTVTALKDTSVRTGPSSANKALLVLEKGYSAELVSIYGDWYRVRVGTKEGYVYASDVRMDSTAIEEINGSVVFIRNSTHMYASTKASNATANVLEGDYAELLSASDEWTRIRYKGKTGYVDSTDVVQVTGSGRDTMKNISRYRYALASKTVAYSVPVADSAYRLGYLSYSEAVWAIEGNASWVKVLVQMRPMYVPVSALSSTPPNGKTAGGYGDYTPGTVLSVRRRVGAQTYSNTSLDEYLPRDEKVYYGSIARGTQVTVVSSMPDLLVVCWIEDREEDYVFEGKLHLAYISVDDVI